MPEFWKNAKIRLGECREGRDSGQLRRRKDRRREEGRMKTKRRLVLEEGSRAEEVEKNGEDRRWVKKRWQGLKMEGMDRERLREERVK